MLPCYVRPVRETTGARVEEQDNEDRGAAAFQDAKQDTEVLSQGERLQQLRSPAASVTAHSEKSQGHSRNLEIADAAIVFEGAQRSCRESSLANETSALEMSMWPQTDAGITDAIPTSETSLQPFRNPRFDNLTSAPETSDPFCHGLSVNDATLVLETSELPCCGLYVGDAPLLSQAVQQPGFESKIFSLGPATKTRFVQKVDSLRGIAKRLLLRRSVSELRRRKRVSSAFVQVPWGGVLVAKQNKFFDGDDPFFCKHKSMLDAPLYNVYRSEESEVPWFADKPGVLLEHTDYFTEAASDVDGTGVC